MEKQETLCKGCADKMYTDQTGVCKLCKAETSSGSFKICKSCSNRWKLCQACLASTWDLKGLLAKSLDDFKKNPRVAAALDWLDKNLLLASVALLALAGTLYFGSALLQKSSPATYSVKLKKVPQFGSNTVGVNSIDDLIRKHDSKASDLFLRHNDDTDLGRWISISDDDEDLGQFLEDNEEIIVFVRQDTIRLIDPVEVKVGRGIKNPKTWNLDIIRAAEAHKMLGNAGRTVIGAVIDTGMDLDHPALKDRLVPGRDIVRNTDDPRNRTPGEMHATHVASTGIMDPKHSGGAYGVAYPVLKIMPVRVLDGHSGSYQNIAKGIVWAADHGAEIINMSLGGTYSNALLHDAVKYAVNEKKVLIIAAKGNSNTSSRHYPSDYPEVLSVTATDDWDQRASFSNYGKNSGAAAPGKDIYGALPGGRFGYLSGTSMASPHVFAAAAIIKARNPNLTPAEIRAIIERHGDRIKTDRPIGLRINLANFLKAVEKK